MKALSAPNRGSFHGPVYWEQESDIPPCLSRPKSCNASIWSPTTSVAFLTASSVEASPCKPDTADGRGLESDQCRPMSLVIIRLDSGGGGFSASTAAGLFLVSLLALVGDNIAAIGSSDSLGSEGGSATSAGGKQGKEINREIDHNTGRNSWRTRGVRGVKFEEGENSLACWGLGDTIPC